MSKSIAKIVAVQPINVLKLFSGECVLNFAAKIFSSAALVEVFPTLPVIAITCSGGKFFNLNEAKFSKSRSGSSSSITAIFPGTSIIFLPALTINKLAPFSNA